MSDDLIKRSDAIKIMACEMYAEAQSQGYEVDSIEDFMPEAKAWMNDAPSADIDLSEYSDKLWRNAYERGKADRPQGEWIEQEDCWQCSECGDEYVLEVGVKPIDARMHYCPSCGAMMKGADDE